MDYSALVYYVNLYCRIEALCLRPLTPLLYCMMPRVGKVQVHADGRISLSAMFTYCMMWAESMSDVPLSWLLATREESKH